jgi:hypothetical protein
MNLINFLAIITTKLNDNLMTIWRIQSQKILGSQTSFSATPVFISLFAIPAFQQCKACRVLI